MKRYKGIILGVCSTIGNYFGIEPWILRIVAIIFFSGVISAYIALAIIFALFLPDGDKEIKEEEKKAKKAKKKLLEESKTEYIKTEDFEKPKYSERPNGNLMKN
jgi:phage shock protein PspC (stress-responsive transcriptional regulator)